MQINANAHDGPPKYTDEKGKINIIFRNRSKPLNRHAQDYDYCFLNSSLTLKSSTRIREKHKRFAYVMLLVMCFKEFKTWKLWSQTSKFIALRC